MAGYGILTFFSGSGFGFGTSGFGGGGAGAAGAAGATGTSFLQACDPKSNNNVAKNITFFIISFFGDQYS